MGKNHRLEHFSIGSFSVSLLAGKIMFRNLLYITSDYTIKINDGYVIFSYWRLVPKKSEIEVDRTKGLLVLTDFTNQFSLSAALLDYIFP
jgi:hypothetical protein